MRMNEDVKALWLDALRSGRFNHARYRLETYVGNCCLGVLCELAIEAGLDIRKKTRHTGAGPAIAYSDDECYAEYCEPPETVMNWAGLGSIEASQLSTLNDQSTDGYNPAIKYIEESL